MTRFNDLRILIVLDSVYPSIGGGGAEQQVRTLSRSFVAGGASVTIIAPRIKGGPQKVHDEIDDVPVYRISYPSISVVGAIVLQLRLALYLVMNRNNYDVVHVHIAHHMAAVSCCVGSFLKKPVLVKLTGWLELTRGILHDETAATLLGRWMRRQLSKASYYQALSVEIQEKLDRQGYEKRKIIRLPNAVDTERYIPKTIVERAVQRQKMGITSARVAVFVGRLVPEKSLDVLIKAWAETMRDSDTSLLIIGEGELEKELTKLAADLGVADQVFFKGPSDDVASYLCAADFGVLPSAYEGLSNTLLEYMASGLAVLGSNVSGTQDLIDHAENGLLFTPGSVSELASCLETLRDSSDEQLLAFGLKARAKVLAYAGIDTVTSTLAELYRNVRIIR